MKAAALALLCVFATPAAVAAQTAVWSPVSVERADGLCCIEDDVWARVRDGRLTAALVAPDFQAPAVMRVPVAEADRVGAAFTRFSAVDAGGLAYAANGSSDQPVVSRKAASPIQSAAAASTPSLVYAFLAR